MAEKTNALEDLVQTRLVEVSLAKQANERMYTQTLQETADLLESTPEAVHDALSETCIENSLRMNEVLFIIYAFLLHFTSKHQKEE